MLSEVSKQLLAQLNAHRYEAMFVALSFNPKRKVVEIDIHAMKAEQLVHSQAGVKRGKGRNAHSGLITPDGLPVYKLGHVLRGKRC